MAAAHPKNVAGKQNAEKVGCTKKKKNFRNLLQLIHLTGNRLVTLLG